MNNPTALQKLKTGELAALVRMIGKPIDFFSKIPANSGLHFVPIPFSKIFADYYALGELTSKEYPTLVPDGQSVDTIVVPAVLAVYNWSKVNDRHRHVARSLKRFHQMEQVSGTPASSLMARCQSCGDRSRLDSLERRGRDIAAAPPKGDCRCGGDR